MKKKLYLLTIMAVIAAVVAVTAAGCVTDVTIDEIWDLAANIGDNADIHILINEGDVRLYEYETENGAVVEDYCIAPDIAPDIADKLGGSGALTFRTEYFSDGVTTRQGDNVVYTANVIQPAADEGARSTEMNSDNSIGRYQLASAAPKPVAMFSFR